MNEVKVRILSRAFPEATPKGGDMLRLLSVNEANHLPQTGGIHMKEIREGINEHIVSEKMRDILLLIVNRIEENSDGLDDLYNSEVKRKEFNDLKEKLADLLDIPRANL